MSHWLLLIIFNYEGPDLSRCLASRMFSPVLCDDSICLENCVDILEYLHTLTPITRQHSLLGHCYRCDLLLTSTSWHTWVAGRKWPATTFNLGRVKRDTRNDSPTFYELEDWILARNHLVLVPYANPVAGCKRQHTFAHLSDSFAGSSTGSTQSGCGSEKPGKLPSTCCPEPQGEARHQHYLVAHRSTEGQHGGADQTTYQALIMALKGIVLGERGVVSMFALPRFAR